MKRLLVIVALLGLFGCNTTPAVKPPVVVVTPTGPATSAQIIALEEQLAEYRDLSERAAGAVWGAQDANAQNVPGLPTEAVSAQLQEAASALPAVPDAKKLEKANQNARILAGQLAAVKVEMGQVMSENEKIRANLSKAEQDLKRIVEAALKERAGAAAALQTQFDSMTKLIRDAQAAAQKAADDARNAVMLEQVKWLNRFGAGCAAVAVAAIGLAAVFGGLVALRGVAPFAAIAGLGSLVCFGLAQIVSLPWFKWAVLGSVVLALGAAVLYVWQKHKGDLKKEAAVAEAAKLSAVTTKIVPAIDKFYDTADEKTRASMDEVVFTPLSKQMDKAEKATVHEIRATT